MPAGYSPRKRACARTRVCTRKSLNQKNTTTYTLNVLMLLRGRGDLLQADVDTAPFAARGVRRAAWRGEAAPTASPGWSK